MFTGASDVTAFEARQPSRLRAVINKPLQWLAARVFGNPERAAEWNAWLRQTLPWLHCLLRTIALRLGVLPPEPIYQPQPAESYLNRLDDNGYQLQQLAPEVLSMTPQARCFYRQLNAEIARQADPQSEPTPRLRLAIVAPLPPERSGIADYTAELLPVLAKHYDIDVVTDQQQIDDDWVRAHCQVLSTDAFVATAHDYDRVVYQFGNNNLHRYMPDLLKDFPGVVVLHDFFLSGLEWNREVDSLHSNALWRALYTSHGYHALSERVAEHDKPVVMRYPCNFAVIANAFGLIVHSDYAAQLALQWYGSCESFSVIPLLREAAKPLSREEARAQLGFAAEDFLVCSFGFLAEAKLNHRILEAWAASQVLKHDQRCQLIFVGEQQDAHYASQLKRQLRRFRLDDQVTITGWIDSEVYRQYLAAADVAVQLRASSRGEMSAAVLDCLNYGVVTIVNANDAIAALADDYVVKLADDFAAGDLQTALEHLYANPAESKAMAQRGQAYLHSEHAPENCAQQYYDVIERYYQTPALQAIVQQASALGSAATDAQIRQAAVALAEQYPRRRPAKRYLLDVTAVMAAEEHDQLRNAAVQQILALIAKPPAGYRVEPVRWCYEDGQGFYRYARDFTLGLLNIRGGWLVDEPVDVQDDDVLQDVMAKISSKQGVSADEKG